MGVMENIRQWVAHWLIGDEYFDKRRVERLTRQQESYYYYVGNQRRQIVPKSDQADDNLIHNYAMLIVNRSVSMLLGDGVEFDHEDETAQAYLDAVWAANKKDILLQRAAQAAAIFDTGYIKIIPGGIEYQDEAYPRLISLDPRWMTIHCDPEDMDRVLAYEMRYNVTDLEGQEIGRRELTKRIYNEAQDGTVNETWEIVNYKSDRSTAGKWEEVSRVVWPYPFAPIVHWANLPLPGSQNGISDLSDIIGIQDRINFVSSNISKIIRYHAHPKTWGRGINLGNRVSWGGDEMITVQGDGTIENLEMQSDLTSSQAYLMHLRQSLFDISRTVDISSMSDKLGALTNFGLHVLYTDALAKQKTKQSLMGEALEQLNQRMLFLAGHNDERGAVVWDDTLPRDELTDMQAAQIELGMGTVSKQTIANESGRDWEQEQDRMSEEKTTQGNVGLELIRSFNAGL